MGVEMKTIHAIAKLAAMVMFVDNKEALDQMTRTGRHFGEVLLKLGLMGPHDLFTEIESHLMKKVRESALVPAFTID